MEDGRLTVALAKKTEEAPTKRKKNFDGEAMLKGCSKAMNNQDAAVVFGKYSDKPEPEFILIINKSCYDPEKGIDPTLNMMIQVTLSEYMEMDAEEEDNEGFDEFIKFIDGNDIDLHSKDGIAQSIKYMIEKDPDLKDKFDELSASDKANVLENMTNSYMASRKF